uniref:Replication-associated protein n=1 Tax=Emberiza rustica CRESS-DNA-virus sp. TaxID=2815032 RepID=A0A8A4XC68_9VIRU|nr:MAG: replication-associated protein [Emberiza rustica CRESS-DNA-virus sp.]
MASKCAVWSWRSHDVAYDWKAWCGVWGKAWVFQLERGEVTNALHYQGIISLKTKRTKAEVLSVMRPLPAYFEPVCDASIRAGSEAFYVTKPDTRVDGPWSDKDIEVYIPRQYRDMETQLRPWQQVIWDSSEWWQPRIVNAVVDPAGNSGKTTIASLMELHDRALDLPPTNDKKELIQSLADILIAKRMRKPKCLFIDIPRADKQDKLFGLYAAIEQIKKGKVTDTRYCYKEWWFDSPVVWVFCNTRPDVNMLSSDRWKFWSINENMELVAE